MPEITVIHIAILVAATVGGSIIGWILRGKRSQQEKAAVSASWQEQINAQRTEHDRLTDQNKRLMEQVSQYLASNTDAKNRSRELSEAVQEAFARRDLLQREIKDIRGNLEVVLSERDQLQLDMQAQTGEFSGAGENDSQVAKLRLELESWQNRLPPLIERFRIRDEEAEQLEADLRIARERIVELEALGESSPTSIEAVSDPEALTDGRDASNDPIEEEPQPESVFEEDEPEDELSDTVRDKLQSIKGIGPAIEKTLNEVGIFRFSQIAQISEYEIDRIAKRLKGFRSRIYREDWIGQARELRDQESSE